MYISTLISLPWNSHSHVLLGIGHGHFHMNINFSTENKPLTSPPSKPAPSIAFRICWWQIHLSIIQAKNSGVILGLSFPHMWAFGKSFWSHLQNVANSKLFTTSSAPTLVWVFIISQKDCCMSYHLKMDSCFYLCPPITYSQHNNQHDFLKKVIRSSHFYVLSPTLALHVRVKATGPAVPYKKLLDLALSSALHLFQPNWPPCSSF